MPQRWTHKSPGYSDLSIVFEGLYIESEENDGERVLCLLGWELHYFLSQEVLLILMNIGRIMAAAVSFP